jgi:ribosomal protein S18 acetylase RimI-like enzyme
MGTTQVMVKFRVDDAASPEVAAQLWPVYDAVFGDHSDGQTWQQSAWDKHSAREGFRLARAYDAGSLVGFAYGYTGEPGQWWTDSVRPLLEPEVAESWLGGHFELVSLGVLPVARRRGIARGLMHLLLREVPHDRMLLMTTADTDDPARRLYAAEGWRVLGPGVGEATVTMGRRMAAPQAS